MAQAEEVDRPDKQRVADSGGHASDVEQRIDVAAYRRDSVVDGCRLSQVDGMKLGDVGARRMLIQPDDVGSELGQLSDNIGPDSRRATGHHRAATVVTPQLVDLSQVSSNFRYHDC